MRIANVGGRAHLIVGGEVAADVGELSSGLFGPDLPALYDQWPRFRLWAEELDLDKVTGLVSFSPSLAGPPSPAPKQVFALAQLRRACC